MGSTVFKTAWQSWLVRAISVAFIVFQLLTSSIGQLPDMRQRAVHVMFAFVLALALSSPLKNRIRTKIPVGDLVLMGLVVFSCANVYFNYIRFCFNPLTSTNLDLFLGIALILLALEVSRRTIGLVFPVMTVIIVLYALFGQLIPGPWGHAGLGWTYIVQLIYQNPSGVWGFITAIVATMVAMFIIFGAFLYVSGGGRAFIDLALVVAGRAKGGPALVAVMSSALFGTVCGSAVTNTAMTGNFTIPLMKRLGYKPEFAGAVEATASSGGMIMPPVMAIGAFIMAEFLGVPYIYVCIAAAFPAILYFLSVGLAVRFKALQENLASVPANEIPPAREVLRPSKFVHLFIPLIVLVVMLLMGFTVTRVAFYAWGIGCILFIGGAGFHPQLIKQRLITLVSSFEEAARTIILVTPLLVCANIVVALVGATGLAVKIQALILSVAGFSIVIALIIAAVCIMVLGMGLPSVAAYILAAAMVGPALFKVGFSPLSTHMFLFYFATFGVITPPVCAVAFVAAAIAHTSWIKVAWQSMRLAIVAYVIPFFFIGQPTLLLQGTASEIMPDVLTALVGTVFLAGGMTGYLTGKLTILSRIPMLAGGILLMYPGVQTDIWGALALGLVILLNINRIWPLLLSGWKRLHSRYF